MNAVLRLTAANIRSFTRDRQALFWTLLFPLMFVFLFGTIFAAGSSQRSIGFAEGDGSAASKAIAETLTKTGTVKLVDGTQDDLLARMKRGDVSAVVAIPAGFGDTVAAGGGPATITVYTDPSQ